ncbi:DNA repair protein RecO [Pseudalkalibacillus berkeleyi]|uniref:DNA repair protein RecO n=1 Tax=Pseudalkalibacillus berkeleyi TaxID=1069813 RepID=A0ABS9GYZ2_9BACL|nr:DNA repair protein RecO [Pseudalkalibacillus berkeleyi]MCF6137959.1 DNA repair protein RecO [Pseudalkalibacillus berkeleyi]
MLIKTEAIVIRTSDYGESNKVLTVYTKDFGKLGMMARGAKKTKSRLSSVSQLFTHAHFLIQKGSGLGSLSQGEIINTFRGIKQDIIKTAYAAYMVELLDKVTDEHKPSPALFEFLSLSLTYLEEDIDPDVLKAIFEMKMLRLAGIGPQVDRCVLCGRKEGDFSFSISEGGFLCGQCRFSDERAVALSSQTARLLNLFYHIDLSRLGNVSVKKETKEMIAQILTTYIDEYSGIRLKSKRFLDQIQAFE